MAIDYGLQINEAMFSGPCITGYALKPDFLRGKISSLPIDEPCSLAQIEIVSAQQLPKPLDIKGDDAIVNPFVEIQICRPSISDGHITTPPTPSSESSCSKPFRTTVVQANAFNPIWNEQFSFVISPNEAPFVFLRYSHRYFHFTIH